MFTNQTNAATLSTTSSLTAVVEKKLASGVLCEIETGLLFAIRLERMATDESQVEAAKALVEKAKVSMALFKKLNAK